MEPQRSEGRPGFWPTCLAVLVAGWVGGLAVGFLWGVFGSYGAATELMRGFGATPRHGTLLDTILLSLVLQNVMRALVGALVLPRVLRWATGAEISTGLAAVALAVGGLAGTGAWWALVRSGASTASGLSLVASAAGFLLSVWIVRAFAGGRERAAGPARVGSIALLVSLVVLAGAFAVSGSARGEKRDRLDRSAYQTASLAAEQTFAGSYERVARSSRTGPGFDSVTFTAQDNLRSAAAELGRVALRPEQPAGTDPAASLPTVDGMAQIREALPALRAAGYRVDTRAWQLAV